MPDRRSSLRAPRHRSPRRQVQRRSPRRGVSFYGKLAAVPLGLALVGALGVVAHASITGSEQAPSVSSEDAQTMEEFFAETSASTEEPAAPPAELAEPDGGADPRGTATAEIDEEDDEGEEEEDSGSDSEDAGDSGGSGEGGGGGGSGGGSSSVAEEVVRLTNAEREENGCDPLRVDDRLTEAAQDHSDDMAARDYMAHETPEGVGPAERARQAGYDAFAGENVARGQRSAEAVVDAWMDSEGHRANILNCGSEAIGVGETDFFWTQKFGRD